jgi:TolA-binding protein
LSARAAPHARIILAAAVSLLVAGAAFMVLAVGYDEPRIYYRRGQKLYTEGQYQRARAVLRRGLTRHPRSPVVGQTMHHLALTHWRQSDWKAAAGVWRALVEEYPESRVAPEALYHLGLSRLRVGQPERAVSVWKDLMERFPDSDWSRRARIELDRLSDKDDP